MNQNQRFLVALSNTEHDVPVLQYARMLAECQLGREFRFVHVPIPSNTSGALQPVIPGNDLATQLTREVESHFGVPPAGVSLSSHILEGERVDALLEFATRSRADVILLGHRQQRSGQRSLARRLAMISPSSVWMVPQGAPLSVRRILAPVDFSKHSADSLGEAVSIAKAAGLDRCLALHVYFADNSGPSPEHDQAARQGQEEAFQKFLASMEQQPLQIETKIEEGSLPSRTILRIAREEAADLIVMNTRGRRRAAAILLGSVTTQVMVETPVAILAVKHFGAAMGLFEVLKDSHFWQQSMPKSN